MWKDDQGYEHQFPCVVKVESRRVIDQTSNIERDEIGIILPLDRIRLTELEQKDAVVSLALCFAFFALVLALNPSGLLWGLYSC